MENLKQNIEALIFTAEQSITVLPFFAENPSATCKKVMDWKNTFFIPKEADLSPEATDLLRRLIRDPSERLGIHGV